MIERDCVDNAVVASIVDAVDMAAVRYLAGEHLRNKALVELGCSPISWMVTHQRVAMGPASHESQLRVRAGTSLELWLLPGFTLVLTQYMNLPLWLR